MLRCHGMIRAVVSKLVLLCTNDTYEQGNINAAAVWVCMAVCWEKTKEPSSNDRSTDMAKQAGIVEY